MSSLSEIKQELLNDIEFRKVNGIIEPTNAELISKLINNADDVNEAMAIAQLGTTYRRTGLHYDIRLEKPNSGMIKYFKKNNKLSFVTDKNSKTHKLIIGDNYDALQNLLITHRNKIDVIYIDPPYGADSMGQFADTNYQNSISRDNLLSMLYPRLILAHQLLSDRGVIFVSIDDRNDAYIKCQMDEIFGEKNYIGNCPRKTKSMTNNVINGFNVQYDTVIIYCKNKDIFKFIGPNKSGEDYSNPDNDPKGDWKSGDPTAKGDRNTFGITNPYTQRVDYPPKGRAWLFNRDKMNDLIKEGKIKFKEHYSANERGFIFKHYREELKSQYETFNSLDLADNSYMNQVGTKELNMLDLKFDFPKPTTLIRKLLSHLEKDVIVLDFFAGSGTTGQAVLEQNKADGGSREFILCTNNEKEDGFIAENVTSKRLKRVMTGKCYDGNSINEWLEKNSPLGDNLEVYDICSVSNAERTVGQTPFDLIDERLYGMNFDTLQEKIHWVCSNFDKTQKYIE